MKSFDHERRHVVEYMACEAVGESITHVEKVHSRHIIGERFDVWDVWTDVGRWWVIEPLMNLYSQDDFKSMEVALTYHLGVREMLRARDGGPLAPHKLRVVGALRKLEQAGEALNEAEEAEDFQAVGVRLREGMIALGKALASVKYVPAGTEAPKAADFVGWVNLIVDAAVPGAALDKVRAHLKGTARTAWGLVNWLTHTENADRYSAEFVHDACYHLCGGLLNVDRRLERGPPRRCPSCNSYRLATDYRTDANASYTVCESCGWEERADPRS